MCHTAIYVAWIQKQHLLYSARCKAERCVKLLQCCIPGRTGSEAACKPVCPGGQSSSSMEHTVQDWEYMHGTHKKEV